jgi:NADH-quinone oxidoreductase subunit N
MLAQIQEQIDTPAVEYSALLPILVMLGGAVLLMVVGAMLPRRTRSPWHATAAVVIAGGSIVSWLPLWFRTRDDGAIRAVADAYRVDGLTVMLGIVIAVGVVLTALLADGYLRRENLEGPEAYVLLLLSAAGGMFMAGANDLLVLFIALEILSISVYVLAGIHVRRARSGEAALKYLILGGVSSAFLLYGIALVYGATGSTNLTAIQGFLAANLLSNNVLLLAGFALLIVGLGFKVAAAPFHSWAPDVYDGSPSPVVAYMASGVKVAGFAALIRVFVQAFGSYRADWQPIIYVIAVATLLVGSVLSVQQTNVKRLLAYSSISHAGFMLLGVQAATDRGVEATLFYLATYTFTVAGAFGIATIVGRKGDNAHDLSHYAGLGKRAPLLAFAFLVFLLAQAGVPATSGFLAKFYVIGAAVDARSFWLGLVAMLSSVISAYAYLKVVLTMYGDEPEEGAPRFAVPQGAKIALTASVLATIGLGIIPGPVADASRTAVQSITDAPAVESELPFEIVGG